MIKVHTNNCLVLYKFEDDQVGHAFSVKTKPSPLSFLEPIVLHTFSLEETLSE